MNCEVCGAKLPPRKAGRPRKVCSAKCRVSLHRAAKFERHHQCIGSVTKRSETPNEIKDVQRQKSGFPVSVLGPRLPWSRSVDPLVLERIRFLEIGR